MRTIWVTFEFEGYHRWEDAPEEVSFLREVHRHLFKCKVEIEVLHDDREIEFFIFKRECSTMLYGQINFRDVGSCEMVAEQLMKSILEKYPNRKISVTVSEDGENGSTVTS